MPVLGMNQTTGKLLRWRVAAGQPVKKGEILMEVETDKAVAEIEAPADGVLAQVTAKEGDEVPVGQEVACIVPIAEAAAKPAPVIPVPPAVFTPASTVPENTPQPPVPASPVAIRMAASYGVDLSQVRPQGGRVEKADVLAYLQSQSRTPPPALPGRVLASPKARRLALERGLELSTLKGSGPQGAVLAGDVPEVPAPVRPATKPAPAAAPGPSGNEISLSGAWQVMAERTTATWTTAPHFYLLREVDAGQLIAWRGAAQADSEEKITYTDLLVKLCAEALARHPNLNVTFRENRLLRLDGIHIGLAAAVEDALVVPVIHNADQKGLAEIAAERATVLERARSGRLRLEDVTGGGFTISNLGMYGVDAFNAVLNGNQAAILAVGRIAERVVAVKGQPAVRPVMILSLSCDHRAVDGARGAQFLDTLAGLIEAPFRWIS